MAKAIEMTATNIPVGIDMPRIRELCVLIH